MKNRNKIGLLVIALLAIKNLPAELKIFASAACATQSIPEAKQIADEIERLQKSTMGSLKELEMQIQKLIAEIQKDSNELMAKRSALSPDAVMKEERKINDKKRRIEELQAQGQRMMQDSQGELQMMQMRMQPYIAQAIQTAIEVATANPNITEVWDETTGQFVYKKPSVDINSEVIKLTQKKNDQKSVLANKPAPSKPAAKVA